MIERPTLHECFELIRRKLRTIVSNQNLRYAKTCKNGPQLANHGFCRDSMQTGNLDEIAEVIGHNKKGRPLDSHKSAATLAQDREITSC